jgi:hypothetical protein
VTIASLSAEIDATHEAFRRLNDSHIPKDPSFNYRFLDRSKEQALIALAERISRLYRFRSLLMVNKV